MKSNNNRFIKKSIVLVLIVTLLVTAFSGCADKKVAKEGADTPDTKIIDAGGAETVLEGELVYEKTGESYTRDENGYPQLDGTELHIWIPMSGDYTSEIDNYTEMHVVQELMRKTDSKLVFTHPAAGQDKEHFALMIAGDTLPDMIFSGGIDNFYPGGIAMAYEDGLLYDYSELVNEKNTPLFLKKVVGDSYVSRGAYDDMGRVIRLGAAVSGSETSSTTMFGIMVRKDMLEATGLAKPVTIDDWTEMLTAMKNNGVEYPLIINNGDYWQTRNAFSAAYGLPAMKFGITEDETVIYGPYEDAYKDYLETMATWYADGLINPDFMNQDSSQTWSMLADDMGAATAEHLWNYNPNYYVAVEEEFPEKGMTALDFPVLEEGDKIRNMVTNRGLSHLKYITADTQKPLACALLLDSLYDEDIEFMMSNGIEGIGYTINDKGYPEISTLSSDTTIEELRSSRIHELETESDSDLEYIITSKYNVGVQPECIETMIKHDYSGTWPAFGVLFTAEESDIISKYETDITAYREEMVLKFVTGNESLDGFAEYKLKLEELHIQELLDVHQAAYDRYLARK